MMLKNRKGSVRTTLMFLSLLVFLPFQNCAKQQVLEDSSNKSEGRVDQPSSKPPVAIETVPLDAKQTLESMLSLVNVATTEMNVAAINGEINYRRNLLVPSNDMALISSPTIIATTSLAAVVCRQAVNKEKAGARDLFKMMDFSKGPGAYGKTGAMNTLLQMADRFWMRNPTKDEVQIFTEMVNEYYSTLDSAALGRATESDKLAIFLCTGMLASPDSYTL